jgi:uncharacterized protein YndB with AHSA1/START domain
MLKTLPLWLTIGLVVLLALGVFLVVVALQPSEFSVTRTAAIAAPPQAVFPHVNEIRKWEAWSPWAKIDPNAKNTFEGPPTGKGAAMAWDGNRKVGQGRMTITESRPNELVRFQLEFYKPMAGTSTVEFTFQSAGRQTTVTWSMSGKNSFLAKAICLFLSMDKMVGGQFETGLASMKAIVEATPTP